MSLLRVFDDLYRWRWWTTVPLIVGFVVFGGVSNRRDDPAAWLALGLFALVVWLPIAVRWIRRAGEARRTFREGLNGG